MCGKPASSMEHVPPKSFFPRGTGLQLKTVPSCSDHNNAKSNDDQYLLAHICLNAAAGENLAGQIFRRSVAPQLTRSEAFKSLLAYGSIDLANGARKYKVDTIRFDNFFDHLSCAIYFDRYGNPLDPARHAISHVYLSLSTSDPHELQCRNFLTMSLGHFYTGFQSSISNYEAAKLDESVYMNKIIDPAGNNASITIAHTFYGIFDVVSLLTQRAFKSR